MPTQPTPKNLNQNTDALFIAWRLQPDDRASAQRTRRKLNSGESRKLFRLRSWVIVQGEVQALLSPAVSLDRIASSIWGDNSSPTSSRWIRRNECAKIVRDMETIPVILGLAARPEQWPWSSASCL